MQTDPSGEAWVVDALEAAAENALARGAPESAVHYRRRALAEATEAERRAELLLGLGRAEARVGDPSAVEHLDQAWAGSTDPERRAAAAAVLG